MKVNQLCINMAKSFDLTIKGMSSFFEGGGSQANVMKLSNFGKQHKVASLLNEMRQGVEVSSETFNLIIDSTYEGDPSKEELRASMKSQFTAE